jgi:hypothetical protein
MDDKRCPNSEPKGLPWGPDKHPPHETVSDTHRTCGGHRQRRCPEKGHHCTPSWTYGVTDNNCCYSHCGELDNFCCDPTVRGAEGNTELNSEGCYGDVRCEKRETHLGDGRQLRCGKTTRRDA